MFTIGVDVGGTTTRAALFDDVGRAVRVLRRPTANCYDTWLAQLREDLTSLAAECDGKERVDLRAGLALPGIVDRTTGRLVRSVNLPFLQGRSIVFDVQSLTHQGVNLCTDAEASTWGEYMALPDPRPPRFAHLRLGTGVACGVVMDGKPVPTDPNRTTHWEALRYRTDGEGPACSCGLNGCLETVASGRALEFQAQQLGILPGCQGLQEAAKTGTVQVMRILREAALAIVMVVEKLIHAKKLDTVSLGGGVISAVPTLEEMIFRAWNDKRDGEGPMAKVRLVRSALGDESGLVGAGLLARANSQIRAIVP